MIITMSIETPRRADHTTQCKGEHCRHHHHETVRLSGIRWLNGLGWKINSQPLVHHRLYQVSGDRPGYLIMTMAKNPTQKIPRLLGFVGCTSLGGRMRILWTRPRVKEGSGRGEKRRMG